MRVDFRTSLAMKCFVFGQLKSKDEGGRMKLSRKEVNTLSAFSSSFRLHPSYLPFIDRQSHLEARAKAGFADDHYLPFVARDDSV